MGSSGGGITEKGLTMHRSFTLQQAQDIVLRVVENPQAAVSIEDLALAVATILVRNELLAFTPPTQGSP